MQTLATKDRRWWRRAGAAAVAMAAATSAALALASGASALSPPPADAFCTAAQVNTTRTNPATGRREICDVSATYSSTGVGPSHIGWTRVEMGLTSPTRIDAYRWSGSQWSYLPLTANGEWGYTYPYGGGWVWVYTQRTGWVAARQGDQGFMRSYNHRFTVHQPRYEWRPAIAATT